jgi:hypothetical protein
MAPFPAQHAWTRNAVLAAGVIFVAACGAPAWKPPVAQEQVGFMARSQSLERVDLTVTVAVPSREETEQLFGTSLYQDRIQPVWVEVENRGPDDYLLMRVGVDENYYSPLETSYQRHSGSKETRLDMDRFFHSAGFHNPIRAGAVTTGYVYTNLDEGAKAVNIDLVGNRSFESFSFVVPVPGLVTDVAQVDVNSLYEGWTELQTPVELRSGLEALACCTRNSKGDTNGDPLNIVMVGDIQHIFSALIRRGWHQTEVTYGASAWKTIKSFLFGTRYRYSPISPLFVFGRAQDVGLQKARESISLRNHMRLWRTRYNYRGKPVLMGQISRDVGVKFNKRTITTHAIDPDVDDTRDGLVGDMAYSQALWQVGYVRGSQRSTLQDTYYNLTPDPYYSDGLRAVMFFDERPIALADIAILDWEHPAQLDTLIGK